jgi:hypothetical protein
MSLSLPQAHHSTAFADRICRCRKLVDILPGIVVSIWAAVMGETGFSLFAPFAPTSLFFDQGVKTKSL